MVPGSFLCGSAVFAAITILAPSRAARRPMARPMPRLAPVMNKVLPRRLMAVLQVFATIRGSVAGSTSSATLEGLDDAPFMARFTTRGQFEFFVEDRLCAR